jgi:hypothetical protein
LLAGPPHFAEHDVAGVTLEFVGGESHLKTDLIRMAQIVSRLF